eukprot:scaffold16367_cov124-Isochrysis_galbana.AAC.4
MQAAGRPPLESHSPLARHLTNLGELEMVFVLAVYEDFGSLSPLHFDSNTWGNASGFATHRSAIRRARSLPDKRRAG